MYIWCETRENLAFSPVSKPHTHITYMLRQCTSIVYIYIYIYMCIVGKYNISVFSLQILIGGDFRIINGEKIWPRVRRPPVGSV